jgi:hypothetical protein
VTLRTRACRVHTHVNALMLTDYQARSPHTEPTPSLDPSVPCRSSRLITIQQSRHLLTRFAKIIIGVSHQDGIHTWHRRMLADITGVIPGQVRPSERDTHSTATFWHEAIRRWLDRSIPFPAKKPHLRRVGRAETRIGFATVTCMAPTGPPQ